MKHPTLQKVSLLTTALVASLALCAQAAPKANVSSAMHNRTKPNKLMTARGTGHGTQSLASTYMLDDGTTEDAVGFGNGLQNFESLWFNHFTVIPGATQISAVEVVWGTPVFPEAINGTPITIGVWSDPNGDGNPSDAALLGSVAGTIQNASTDTFVTYVLSPPVDLPPGATSFFVGDKTPMNNGPEHFFQGIDESSFKRQSWIAAMSSGAPVDFNNPGNNDFLGLIDDFGLPGNWLIRADSGEITPTPTPTATPTPTPTGDVLWYNGDFNFVDGLTNEEETSLGSGQYAHIYDDFNVPAEGFDIGSVFSHDLINTNVTGASWEIRSGVSAFNGGTLVASGMTSTPIVTPTGNSAFGFTEFEVEVPDLNVHLDQGTYWLNVTPIGDLTGRSFDSTTDGANCVGTPCGNNDTAFLDSNFFGANFEPVADFGSQFHDFSMGVKGQGGGGGELALVSAASLQRGFAIDLPISGQSGVEDRSGKANKKFSIAMTFNNPIASVGSASSTCGGVSNVSINGNTVTVNLVGVAHACNGSNITITVDDVMDTSGNSLSSASVDMGLLLGDVNGDRVVDQADIQAVKADKGQHTDSTNFRSDVSNDGFIGAADVQLVRQQQGTSLP